MVRKHKGEWPYHEDNHGNWKPCHSNPCKLHSGGDIMATSPEDAFAKADRLAHHGGGNGYAGGSSKMMDKGMNDARHLAEAHKERVSKVRKAMDSFYQKPIDDPPEIWKEDYEGYLSMGGKYLEVKDKSMTDVAKLMRKDMSLLRKAGGVPKGWKVNVKVDNSSWAPVFDVTIRRPEGTAPAYRSIRPTDLYDPNKEGEGKSEARNMMLDDIGKRSCSYDEAVEYCRQHPEHKILTDDARDTESYVKDLTDQYAMYGSSVRNATSRKEFFSRVHLADDENN